MQPAHFGSQNLVSQWTAVTTKNGVEPTYWQLEGKSFQRLDLYNQTNQNLCQEVKAKATKEIEG
jgi:hypothetical protein